MSTSRAARAKRFGLIAVVLIVAAIAGYALFGQPIEHEIALKSADSAFGSRKINLLVLGYQADEGNSDTVLFAHLDVDRKTATLLSIPRDTWVAMPGHGHEKINAAMGYGGPQLTARIVSGLTGVPVDATLSVDPEGAKQIVDALGGINVNVERDMDYDDNYGNLHVHLKKGEQYLTGGQVLGYIRFRHDAESDWGRMRRQQQVLKNMMAQLSSPQNWSKIPHLLQLVRKDMKTNLTDKQLGALLEIYRGVPDDNVRTLTMPARAAMVGDASVVLMDEQWAKILGRLLFIKNDPPQDEILVANATGVADWNKTVVGALRGGGWNVKTFVDQPVRKTSQVAGSSSAAHALALALPGIKHESATSTMLVLGSDLAPIKD